MLHYLCAMSIRIEKGVLDKLGILASVACAVHCALLPLVITVLPLVGMEFLANEWVEIFMLCLAVCIGAWSLVGAYSLHKSLVPLTVLMLGFALIGTGHFGIDDWEPVLIPLGGLTIAAAHYINWKAHRLTCQGTSSVKPDQMEHNQKL